MKAQSTEAPSQSEHCPTPSAISRATAARRLVINLFLLTAGSVIFAVGLNGALIQHRLLSGGIVGVALVIHYLAPKLNTGLIYFALNVPLILLGWFTVSRKFILYTAYGMASFSLATGFITPNLPHIDNPILAAILAGIITGTGAGLALRSQGSSGGLDILAVYLNKHFSLRVGSTISFCNAVVLAAGAWLFGLELALYSLIYVYTSGRILDHVLTGFNQRKSILIVSDCSQAIADQILEKLHRGVTFLKGTGAYSGSDKDVILSIITLTELSKMKELIFDIDPHAFVVINDTLEVLGKRHGSHRAY